jgi:glycosyltransferase involved in cell wall biosynthesis
MSSCYDISIVLTAHREGMLAHPTLRSALKARACAEANGLKVELIVTLDDSDSKTQEYFNEVATELKSDGLIILVVQTRNLSAARNNAIKKAAGRFIALLDGDDLWCAEWLVAAYRAAQADTRRIAWHPQYTIGFGECEEVLITADMEDPRFRLLDLCLHNYWTALAFAERAIFLETPYRLSNFELTRFGYEDWTWNCDTILHGVLHKIVPETSHFVRRKSGAESLLRRSDAINCLPIPSDLFRLDLTAKSGSDAIRCSELD